MGAGGIAGGGGATGSANAGAGAGGASTGGGAAVGALKAPPEMMRVNSPGPASAAGAEAFAAAGGDCGVSAGGGTRTPSDSLWINLVTLPGSSADDSADGAEAKEGKISAG